MTRNTITDEIWNKISPLLPENIRISIESLEAFLGDREKIALR